MLENEADEPQVLRTPWFGFGTRDLYGILRSYSPLIILSVIWGMAFVAIKAVEPDLSPVNLTLLRWLISSGAFLLLSPFIGKMKKKFERSDIPRFILVSFANVVSYHLTLNYSESTLSAGLAGLLVATGPVFIMILSWLVLGERHGRRIYAAIGLAFAGALILALGSDLTSGSNTLAGILEALGTAFSFAIFSVFSKPLVQKYGARPFTIWTGILGTAMLLPLLSGSFFAQVQSLSLDGWIAMLYLSLLSTAIGYMVFYTLVGRGAVTRLSIQLYLVPLIGVLGGSLLLQESPNLFTFLGGAAMLLAVAFSTKRNATGSRAAK